jgi:peroxiredoxin
MGLNFPLLSDNGAKITRTYDVMSPNDSILKGYSARAIFIVDRDRTVRYCWAPLDTHIQPDYDLVLSKVRELKK